MKAATYSQYGGPDVISVQDIQQPMPKSNQLLVKVHAGTVNRTDTGYRSAVYVISRLFTGLLKPKKQTLGTEFAGEVVGKGVEVTGFSVGDRVYGFDEKNFGGNAEFKVVEYDAMVAHIPGKLSFEQAAPIAEGAHYALHYIGAAKVSAGQKVFVNGGTGAIGSAAIQILVALGASVTASARPEHQGLLAQLGAHDCVDYTAQSIAETGNKYDVIFDAVGKSTFQKCRSALTVDGIYMSSEFGDPPYNPLLALWTKLFSRQKVLFPIPQNKQEDLLYLNSLIDKGVFTPLIDKTYALEEIVAATQYVESGQKVGNVVITIA